VTVHGTMLNASDVYHTVVAAAAAAAPPRPPPPPTACAVGWCSFSLLMAVCCSEREYAYHMVMWGVRTVRAYQRKSEISSR
jgi:hypothetical protein